MSREGQGGSDIRQRQSRRAKQILISVILLIVGFTVAGYIETSLSSSLNSIATASLRESNRTAVNDGCTTGDNWTDSATLMNVEAPEPPEKKVPEQHYSIPQDQLDYCNNHNFVHVGHSEPAFKNENNTRPFSITNRTFQRHHDRFCENSTELLTAITWGRRVWDDGRDNQNMTNREILSRELMESVFVPYQCDIPYLTPMEYCNVAGSFSNIVISGDSLSRHVQGAMLMAYRGDVIKGGLKVKLHRAFAQYRCLCDSQFSESPLCRNNDGPFFQFQPAELNICPTVPVDEQFVQNYHAHRFQRGFGYGFAGINCSFSDYRGLLLSIQGGIHQRWQARHFYKTAFSQGVFENPIIQNCAKEGKLFIIWSTYTAQSPALDDKYAHQSMNNGLTFDFKMKRLLNNKIPTLNWINMTVGSMKSDGLHFLASENLMKAQHLMVLARMLKQENWTL